MISSKRQGMLFSSLVSFIGWLIPLGCEHTSSPRGRPGDILELRVKDHSLRVEVASDDLSRRVGLMDRKGLPENEGMLFVFRQPAAQAFWMKHTYIPLSVAFLDDNGKILQIEDMQPKDETNTVSKNPVRFAIEVNQGWFQKNGIGVGDTFAEFVEALRPFRGS